MGYVVAQFLLVAVIAWPLTSFQLSAVGLLLIVLSILIALSALMVNRPGNFNVRPLPKSTGALIVHGPYRFIRHPMYSSLIFGCLGILICQFSYLQLGAWLFLILVLALKARFEEKALTQHYPQYREYKKTTKAIIPIVW